MIEHVRGVLIHKELTRVTVEAGGVGYDIGIPLSTYEMLPALGAEVKIRTHHHVREDAHKLYGFFTEKERELFRQLIGISKIGPKVALAVLSGLSVDEFIQSVQQANASRLEKIPGVGAKTAQRLLLELKGKLGPVISGQPTAASGSPSIIKGSIQNEVFEAMISLGYNDKQIGKALDRVQKIIEPGAPLEEWIKKTLQAV